MEGGKERRRLLQELGDQRIPFLGPSDHGFQQLWETSYSGLALRRSCSLPEELHGRVEAALLTLRQRGCFLRDLVKVRDRDVFTAVSRVLLGQPGTTYRYLDTRLFTIPWHADDQRGTCCDPDLSAACKALWELNCFFCSDVGHRKEGDVFKQCRKELVGAIESKPSVEGDTESKDSEESKPSDDGGDSESKQSEEGETESKHSEDWDIESKHSEEEGPSSKQDAAWESRHSDEMGDMKPKQTELGSPTGSKQHSEGKHTGWKHRPAGSTETETTGLGPQEKPVAELKHSLSGYHIEDEDEDQLSGQGCSHLNPAKTSCPGPAQFNVTLLNYMDPAAMSQLKEEPYYGMGKMAVGWHHDENLVSLSPVAVYSYSCHDDDKGVSSEEGPAEKGCWRIGLKVAWDIHTPGLTLPLQSGDCYYMRDDLNRTHQHCVLAGDSARFSSTHRVAECSTGTLDYIQSRCREALSNLSTDPETGTHSLLSLLPATLQGYEEIHNEVGGCVGREQCSVLLVDVMWEQEQVQESKQKEAGSKCQAPHRCRSRLALRLPSPCSAGARSPCRLKVEFEWLRQYWFQGQRYTRFCSWWARPMEQLENDWREMELMVRLHRDTLGP
ncbi:unnamed protein product [Coregonus sp. 'balchen']|nr:unnamed protein product [Coregonus sp. 'balchen']